MMELFPSIWGSAEVNQTPLPTARECAWDFDEGKPIFRGGAPLTVTGKEAVKVWAWKALRTPRTLYEIYTWNFGSEVHSLIGQNYTGALKQAEAARYVREALVVNPYITDVSGIRTDFTDNRMTISAKVQTVYGEVELNV